MKKIDNEGLQLVYDEHCPLCNWYTGKFIRFHFLNQDGRIAWSVASQNSALEFDRDLSRNKIALLKNGTAIKYGVDSLLEVLSLRWSLVGKIGGLPVVREFLLQLYNFISYNRKVIAPNSCDGSCECNPDSQPFYRWMYIFLVGCLVNLATGLYFRNWLSEFYTGNPVWTELVLYSGQFLIMYLIFVTQKRQNFLDYAGNLATVSLIGALLLLVFQSFLFLISKLGIHTEMLAPFGFGIVFFVMWQEHRRRIRILGLGKSLSRSWLMYRIFIYPFAFVL